MTGVKSVGVLAWVLLFEFCTAHDHAKNWIDLSHPFSNRTIYFPGNKHFSLTNTVKGLTPGGFWLELNEYEAAEHGGTHMDAPSHFAEGGASIDEIPLERFIGPAVVIDVRQQAALNPDYAVTVDDVMNWERMHGPIPNGAYVFLYAGWDVRWPDREQYLGNANDDATNLHFPGFSLEAAQWMEQNRVITAVGSDTPSSDIGPSLDYPVHQYLLPRNIYILENVNNLGRLPPAGATVFAFPMKIKYGSAAPTRLLALLPDGPATPTSAPETQTDVAGTQTDAPEPPSDGAASASHRGLLGITVLMAAVLTV